ncbi:hypothetical protein Sta7437_4212 [Stanieria cyanosphaera PCC 7437]|uniref:Uncharacterized protein n=1 Tax=Stanieria cyanosphaera (strain ATCC 29371 / PCC 7437) TaxID=111780 RepID=K9XZX5_STAC7|nr:hypothetical protein [Stanieria cyanosphaera]AFZ37686.1 hypothetical protein Sta7437_4212 [Stanieria cyanosphaera PCC 7437]
MLKRTGCLANRQRLMNVKWKKLLFKTTIWLVAEISLNSLGLDSLADYSEFLFERTMIMPNTMDIIFLV